jgi:hypothetical protein
MQRYENIGKEKIPKKKIENINKPKIDSLSLWIRIESCNILNKELTSKTRTFYIDSKTYSEDQPRKALIYETECQTSKISIKLKQLNEQSYIVLTLYAKLLGKDYFNGINKNNIKELYVAFMRLKVFECSYDSFVGSLANDIDICKDMYIKNFESFDKITNTWKTMSKDNVRYVNRFSIRENKGIEFNKREKGTIGKPYVKMYFKEVELATKSKELRDKHLKEYDVKNLIRIEATLKNRKTINAYIKRGIVPKFRTLEDLMNIEGEELDKFLTFSIESYINENTIFEDKNNTRMKPTDQVIKELIKIIVEKEIYNETTLIQKVVLSINDEDKEWQKVARSRQKTKLKNISKKLYKEDENYRKMIDYNEDFQMVMKELNIEVK